MNKDLFIEKNLAFNNYTSIVKKILVRKSRKKLIK